MRTLSEDGVSVILKYRARGKNTSKAFQLYDTEVGFEDALSDIIQKECEFAFNCNVKPYGIYCAYGNVKNKTFYTTSDIDDLIFRIKRAINEN